MDSIFGVDATPIAGVLYLNDAIKVVTDDEGTYEDRNRVRDSLQGIIVPKQIRLNAQQKKQGILIDSLLAKNTITDMDGAELTKDDIKTANLAKGFFLKPKPIPAAPKVKIDQDSIKTALTKLCNTAGKPLTWSQRNYIQVLQRVQTNSTGDFPDITRANYFPGSEDSINKWINFKPKLDQDKLRADLVAIAAFNDTVDKMLTILAALGPPEDTYTVAKVGGGSDTLPGAPLRTTWRDSLKKADCVSVGISPPDWVKKLFEEIVSAEKARIAAKQDAANQAKKTEAAKTDSLKTPGSATPAVDAAKPAVKDTIKTAKSDTTDKTNQAKEVTAADAVAAKTDSLCKVFNKFMDRLNILADKRCPALLDLMKDYKVHYKKTDSLKLPDSASAITASAISCGALTVDTTLADSAYAKAVKTLLRNTIAALGKNNKSEPLLPTADQAKFEQVFEQTCKTYNVGLNGSPMHYTDHFKDCSEITDLDITALAPKPVVTDTNSIKKGLLGVLAITDSMQTDFNKAQAAYKSFGIYIVKDIQFQFEQGFLERVQVTVDYKGKDQIFENIYALGFSSIQNYRNFTKTTLWIRNSNNADAKAAHLYFSDVLQNYQNELDNFTRDYSPADTSFHVDPAKQMQVTLHKDNLVNIFETRAYTDLDGVGSKNPNGLVQMQISRNIYLVTQRRQMGISRSDYGYMNYVHIEINAEKLENKSRRLILNNLRQVSDNQVITPSYAPNLDFRRYENFSIVVEPNVFLLDFPEAKMTFHADMGFRYGYTPVTDSILTVDTASQTVKSPVNANNYDANTFSIYPKLWLQIFSEYRYGITVGYQFNTTWLFSNNLFKQVVSASGKAGDLQTNPLDRAARFSHIIELSARVQPNKKDKNGNLFFVARFFMQQHDVNTFFPQIQIGYAYNLLFKK